MLCRQVFDKISREFHGISHIIVNFTGFCRFTWNSRLSDCAKYQKPSWYCELVHLHHTNWGLKICTWRLHFSSLSPKGNLKIFLISSPVKWYGVAQKKHRKFEETDSSLLVLYCHFFAPCFTSHHCLLSQHLEQDTALGEQFQLNPSILSSSPIN